MKAKLKRGKIRLVWLFEFQVYSQKQFAEIKADIKLPELIGQMAAKKTIGLILNLKKSFLEFINKKNRRASYE